MNREILFRGQTRKHGEKVRMNGEKLPGNWVYGGIFPGTGDYSIIYGWKSEDNHTGNELEKFAVYSDTVGQYTGLTDIFDVKIFEGDICRITVDGESIEENAFVIKWNNGNSEFMAESRVESIGLGYVSVVEVIGNIYDNPELLKGGSEDV